MVFARLVRALHNYNSKSEEEHNVAVDDTFLILDLRSSDDWMSGVKYVPGHVNFQESVRLIPTAYVEEVQALGTAVAQYSYEASNWDELNLHSDVVLEVYDDRDPEWWVSSCKPGKDIGLVPSTYLKDYTRFSLGYNRDVSTGTSIATEEKSGPLVGLEREGSLSDGDDIVGSLESKDSTDQQKSSLFLVVDRIGQDKSFKKERFLGFENDGIQLSESTPDRKRVEFWKYSDLTHFSIKKHKYLILEMDDYTRTIEIIKSHCSKIKKLVEKGILESKSVPKSPLLPLGIPPAPVSPEPQEVPSSLIAPKPQSLMASLTNKKYSADSSDYHNSSVQNNVNVISTSSVKSPSAKSITHTLNHERVTSEVPSAAHSTPKPLEYSPPQNVSPTNANPPQNLDRHIAPTQPDATSTKFAASKMPHGLVKNTRQSKTSSFSSGELPSRPKISSQEQEPPTSPPPRPSDETLNTVLRKINNLSINPTSQPSSTLTRQHQKKSSTSSYRPPSSAHETPAPSLQKQKIASGTTAQKDKSSPHKSSFEPSFAKKEGILEQLPPGFRVWSDASGTFTTVARLLEVHQNREKVMLVKINGVKISVPTKKLSAKDKTFIESAANKEPEDLPTKISASLSSPPRTQTPSSAKPSSHKHHTDFNWMEFFINVGVSEKNSEAYAHRIKTSLSPDFDASKLSYRVLKNIVAADDADILRILNILEAENSSSSGPKQGSTREDSHVPKQVTFTSKPESSVRFTPQTSETPPHPFTVHPSKSTLPTPQQTVNNSTDNADSPDVLAQRTEMLNNDLKKKRCDTEEALKLAQKTLVQARDEVLKASIIREESKKVRAEAVLKRAQDTAKQALVMSIQAKEGYLRAVKDASRQAQHSHARTHVPQLPLQAPQLPQAQQMPQFQQQSLQTPQLPQFFNTMQSLPPSTQIGPQVLQLTSRAQGQPKMFNQNQLSTQWSHPQLPPHNFISGGAPPTADDAILTSIFPPTNPALSSNSIAPARTEQGFPAGQYYYNRPSLPPALPQQLNRSSPYNMSTHQPGNLNSMNAHSPGSYAPQSLPQNFPVTKPSVSRIVSTVNPNTNTTNNLMFTDPHSQLYQYAMSPTELPTRLPLLGVQNMNQQNGETFSPHAVRHLQETVSTTFVGAGHAPWPGNTTVIDHSSPSFLGHPDMHFMSRNGTNSNAITNQHVVGRENIAPQK